jgi:(2R)-3-sulfolactate dehydrogenase (NADP+)
MDAVRLSLHDARELVVRALVASRVSEVNAKSTAAALVAAEADGQKGHGLSRVPSYAAQARSGKVDGFAVPTCERPASALLRIDARSGFAYPAADIACQRLAELVKVTGVASACIHNSHHLGQAGAHAERLAEQGLVALVFSNSPKAISFWGGREPVMGTNPVAFAAPLAGAAPVVIDVALSKVARGKILAAQKAGEKIPLGWALDERGEPTDDPAAAMAGSLLPIGGAKGAALVLMVELLAAALTGSNFGFEASSFFDASGDPPHIGHVLIVFDAAAASGGRFPERLATIVALIGETEGARLPGTSRIEHRAQAEADGLSVPAGLHSEINDIIDSGAAGA